MDQDFPAQAGHREAGGNTGWAAAKGRPNTGSPLSSRGRVMFEIAGVSEEIAKEALRLAAHKLPIKCKVLVNDDFDAEAFSKINFKTQIVEEVTDEAAEGEEETGW